MMYPIEILKKFEQQGGVSVCAGTDADKCLVCPVSWQMEKLLYLPPDLFWFKGHFPELPVLPGIAQTNWVIEWTLAQEEALTGRHIDFAGIEVVKFQKPLQSDQTVKLLMTWDAQKLLMAFVYLFAGKGCLQAWPQGELRVHSSGKIKFKVVE